MSLCVCVLPSLANKRIHSLILVNLGHHGIHTPQIHQCCALGHKAMARPQRCCADKKAACP